VRSPIGCTLNRLGVFSYHHSEHGHLCRRERQRSSTGLEITPGKNEIDPSHCWLTRVRVQLDETGLTEGLLKRTIFAHGESVVTPLTQEQAFDVR
jgi:hypothetical protein